MAHIYGKIKQIRLSSKFASKNPEKSIAAGVMDDLFPGSLGLPRWRTHQIPNPGAGTKCQNPYSGERSLNQIPQVARFPHPGA